MAYKPNACEQFIYRKQENFSKNVPASWLVVVADYAESSKYKRAFKHGRENFLRKCEKQLAKAFKENATRLKAKASESELINELINRC